MKSLTPVFIAPAIVILASCASVQDTPASRIAANPAAYQALSPKFQQAVSAGQLLAGMPPQAVTLAWGKPGTTFVGSQGNKTVEKWAYSNLEPVYSQTTPAAPWFGGYYGPRARNYYGYYGWSGPSTTITYLPVNYATVNFINGRVTSWEKIQSH